MYVYYVKWQTNAPGVVATTAGIALCEMLLQM